MAAITELGELGKRGDKRAVSMLVETLRSPVRATSQAAAAALAAMNWQPTNSADQVWFGIVTHAYSASFWRGHLHMVAPLLHIFLEHRTASDAYFWQLQHAALALGYIGDPSAIGPLLQLLRPTPSSDLFALAVQIALEALKSVAPFRLKAKIVWVTALGLVPRWYKHRTKMTA